MLAVLLVLIPTGLFIYVIAYGFDRDEARERADEFISGVRKPTPDHIDKCIMKLRIANRRLLSKDETDRRRVKLLLDLREKAVTSPP